MAPDAVRNSLKIITAKVLSTSFSWNELRKYGLISSKLKEEKLSFLLNFMVCKCQILNWVIIFFFPLKRKTNQTAKPEYRGEHSSETCSDVGVLIKLHLKLNLPLGYFSFFLKSSLYCLRQLEWVFYDLQPKIL